MKPVSMPFETGFIALRKYLRWPTQLLASAYSRFYCHICHTHTNLLVYSSLMVATTPVSIATLLSPIATHKVTGFAIIMLKSYVII